MTTEHDTVNNDVTGVLNALKEDCKREALARMDHECALAYVLLISETDCYWGLMELLSAMRNRIDTLTDETIEHGLTDHKEWNTCIKMLQSTLLVLSSMPNKQAQASK